MAEGLAFDLRKTHLDDGPSQQLQIATSADIYEIAAERDADFKTVLATLTGQHVKGGRRPRVLRQLKDPERPGGLSFAIDAAVIGGSKLPNKLQHLRLINRLIGGLAAAHYPRVAGQAPPADAVYLEAYHPLEEGTDSFAIIGHVRLPLNELSDEAMSEVALQSMREYAGVLNCYGRLELSTDPIRAEVDRGNGVELSQSLDSNIHTSGEGIEPDSSIVRLSGNNVVSPHEPLIYLVGMVALAQSAELAAR